MRVFMDIKMNFKNVAVIGSLVLLGCSNDMTQDEKLLFCLDVANTSNYNRLYEVISDDEEVASLAVSMAAADRLYTQIQEAPVSKRCAEMAQDGATLICVTHVESRGKNPSANILNLLQVVEAYSNRLKEVCGL